MRHDERLAHLLWEVSARTSTLGEAALASTSLSQSGLGIMDMVAANPGISSAEITRRVPQTQQAISQVVTRLEGLGLIERRLLGGRSIGLYLTAAGKRAHDESAAAEVAFERRLEAVLGNARYERLRKLLVETRSIVEKLDNDTPSAAAERRTNGKRRTDDTGRAPRVKARASG